MLITIAEMPFDPWQALQEYQLKSTLSGQAGATAIFVGTMRDFNQGDDVKSMTLEHYPGMTEKHLGSIITNAEQKWSLLDCFVTHRVGTIYPEQAIVLVAVWSVHRGDAFDACRSIMEDLKAKAPFWKKEHLTTNESRWVEHNSDGYLDRRSSKKTKSSNANT